MKPSIFLDIDGVVNIVSKRQGNLDKLPHLRVWNKWETIEVTSYPITYSPELVSHLNRISEKAEIVWLTTWKEEAVNDFAPAVGLNDFRLIDPTGATDPWGTAASFKGNPENRWWKLNGVLEHITSTGAPFVWIDDELRSPMRNYVKQVASSFNVPNLLFVPYETMGIDSEHINRIDEFIESVTTIQR